MPYSDRHVHMAGIEIPKGTDIVNDVISRTGDNGGLILVHSSEESVKLYYGSCRADMCKSKCVSEIMITERKDSVKPSSFCLVVNDCILVG
jgi:hypothetical protein